MPTSLVFFAFLATQAPACNSNLFNHVTQCHHVTRCQSCYTIVLRDYERVQQTTSGLLQALSAAVWPLTAPAAPTGVLHACAAGLTVSTVLLLLVLPLLVLLLLL